MVPDPFTPQRLVLMTILTAIMAPLAYLLGLEEAASGLVAGTPVALINYSLSYRALQAANAVSGGKGLVNLWWSSLLRLANDMVVLALSAFLGAEFLLGVFAGILLELMTYYIDAGRVLLSWSRGDSGCSVQKKSAN